MRPILWFVVLCSVTAAPLAAPAFPDHFDVNTLVYTKDWDYGIYQELISRLSSTAIVLSPLDAGFVDSTERYLSNVQPKVQLSIQVGTEEDVATVVQYAYSRNISFYAVSRGHALTNSVARFDGIEIDMRNLGGIQIAPDNETVHLQGGVYSDNVIRDLWDQGFVTGTGGCKCVSVVGPALGGGHGLQQGQHGLTMDHFVNLNVVLANGTAVTVNETSNPDLWWAMRGAGHNFGIVTSWDAKIWEENFKTYFVRTYEFEGSALEGLVEELNCLGRDGSLDPVWLAAFGLVTMNTAVSETEPIISWTFVYNGAEEDAVPLLTPFDALDPVSVQDNTTTYPDMVDLLGGAMDSWGCTPNKTHVFGTINLQNYNGTTMRAVYDLYSERIQQHPELGLTHVVYEGYAVAGVTSFEDADSAFPQRDEYILTYFDIRFDTDDDALIGFAEEWRDEAVTLWNEGQPDRTPTTYVNYAGGYESLESRYGYDSWRLERLRALKKEYDPRNKFAWYNPIIPLAGEE